MSYPPDKDPRAVQLEALLRAGKEHELARRLALTLAVEPPRQSQLARVRGLSLLSRKMGPWR